ncbi:uncharacterized protein LOC106133133 [Amyelois transitella]|uniref:uncharacterized protein LOC106133133 n=1 Tax=Amyelois transitella TaxID=680683 RepID=UPI00298FE24A|nr:uncharacterized protein LOC106133133 [Amyelois transitella]
MAHNSLHQEPNCKPLDTYDEIISFLENPPSWRSLCKEMTPHSKKKIRNMSLNTLVGPIGPDRPPTFCHFNPDSEDVERHNADSLPKTLVCHDMANGYHDDSMIDGTSNHLAYTFYHWAGIDIFCYFSHHLITIPPLGWINVGHAHGVKVIGTVITEWTEGYDFWEYVLSSESQYQELANALVSIAKLLKFDGWLLNVENKVSKPLVLVEFVRFLHQRLHEELPEPELVWYDSVTIKGNLNWQNGLNENNKDFFDVCDGFFTNYSWKEEDIESSVEMAGDRLRDLFIGIDVWGRNFYGGGQFNTAAAVELASGYGCSLAIFAPAWTHETADQRDADIALADDLCSGQNVELRERALWGSLWPYLNTNLPCQLPFQSSFCRGQGTKRRLYGEVFSPGPWYNLRHMQYQPNSAYGPHGYLLSTPETIAAVSRSAIVRDKKGIIKFQPAFEMSRHELHSVHSSRELQQEHRDSMIICTIDEEERPRESDRKHSMKNVFKQMFRMKSRRRSVNPEEEPDHPQDNTGSPHGHLHVHLPDEPPGQPTDQPPGQPSNQLPDQSDDQSPDKSDEPTQRHTDLTLERSHAMMAHSWQDIKAAWSMKQLSVNLKLSQPHKLRLALACVPGERPCLEPYYEDSYIGGSSLLVSPADQLSPALRWARLLHCEFPVAGQLVLCVVTKTLPDCDSQYLNVKLFARSPSSQEIRVTCVGRDVPGEGRPSPLTLSLYPLSDGPRLKQLQKYLLLNQPGFYMSPENCFGWRVRYYIAPLDSSVVTSVNLRCGLSSGSILLGHIGLCLRREETEDVTNRIDEMPRPTRQVLESPHQMNVTTQTSTTLGANSPGLIKSVGVDPAWTGAPQGSRGVAVEQRDSKRIGTIVFEDPDVQVDEGKLQNSKGNENS